jgi:hypothetical protein
MAGKEAKQTYSQAEVEKMLGKALFRQMKPEQTAPVKDPFDIQPETTTAPEGLFVPEGTVVLNEKAFDLIVESAEIRAGRKSVKERIELLRNIPANKLTEEQRNLLLAYDGITVHNAKSNGRLKNLAAAGIISVGLLAGLLGGAAIIEGCGNETNAKAGISTTTTTKEKATPTTSFAAANGSPETTATTQGTPTTTTVFEQTPSSVTSTTEVQVSRETMIPLPSEISGELARNLKDGGDFTKYSEGQWFLPVYDEFEANAEHDWRGIGPWYPVFFRSEPGAAHLSTHGNLGELIVVADQGGMVEVGVWQLGPHQTEGTVNGNGDFDPNWALQYTFKGMEPLQKVIPFDPDTGKQLTWEDGTPIVYAASELGDFSVEIPRTDEDQDVRVAFRFFMVPSRGGEVVQPHEIKIERGPNDQPRKTGENLLPVEQVVKPSLVTPNYSK